MVECKEIRKRILELANAAGSNGAHIGGSFSSVEILNSIYNCGLNLNPADTERDRLVLSKGHAALAHYCVLESIGILSKDEVETFEKNGTSFFAHEKRNVTKGIEFSGGSLSLGCSFSIGIALACMQKGYKNHIYVLLGDGECDEGLVWEAVMSAVNYNLNNLTFIVDCNGVQSDGFTKDVMNHSPLEEKFSGFGCLVKSVDGHSMDELKQAFLDRSDDKPIAIIAHTIKGKGVSFMENTHLWHHGVITPLQFEKALEEVRNG